MIHETAQSAIKTKPSDMAMMEVERLNDRLYSTLKNLGELRDRVSGSTPQSSGDAATAETAFNLSGFVGSVGQSLERAHRTMSEIDYVLNEVANVI